jgi:hypothetical protein
VKGINPAPILLVVAQDTPCRSILLVVVERDTPCKLQVVERVTPPYTAAAGVTLAI